MASFRCNRAVGEEPVRNVSSKSAKVNPVLPATTSPTAKTAAAEQPNPVKPVSPLDATDTETVMTDDTQTADETIVAPAPEVAPQMASEDVVAAPVVAPAPAIEPPFRSPPKMPGHMPAMHGRPQIVPRAMAAKENFVEGDYVVYPTHGVGKVERIATEEIAGHKLELIHITFEENRMTLRVPVSKARTAGLRKLATRKVFDEALALLKGRARIKRTMWSRRAQEYEQKINSGDPMQIAEVVRDLHRNAGQPDQSFSERQIYEAAMDRLAAELAALDQVDKGTALTKLSEYLKTIQKGSPAESEPIEEDAEVE